MSAATVMVRLDSLPQDVVEKIMAAAESPNLPTVTKSDEGKVAVVNNKGKWIAGEGGSGGEVLVVHDVDGTLDKTWQEIADSDLCVLNYGAKMIQYGVSEPISQGKFKVFFWDFYESSRVVYEADTPTDYPVYVEEA